MAKITLKGNAIDTIGELPAKGSAAPNFTLVKTDLAEVTLADYKGKTLILSVVPSLDTGVCDMQTRRLNNEAAALGAGVRILTLSCDLPFAQARWCGAAGATQLETLSDHRDLSFGMAYGVVIKELRLLTRAIFVVNPKGTLTYCEIVPEVTSEVNYDAALKAAQAAV